MKKHNRFDYFVFQNEVLTKGYHDEDVIQILTNFINMIISRHFFYVSSETKKDLASEGMCKAIEMLNSKTFDPNISTLVNFLYAGIRNELGNFLHRIKREILLDTLPVCQDRFHEARVKMEISYNFIRQYLKPYFIRVGDCSYQVVQKLSEKGLKIIDLPLGFQKIIDMNSKVVDQLVCLIIWRTVQESCLA